MINAIPNNSPSNENFVNQAVIYCPQITSLTALAVGILGMIAGIVMYTQNILPLYCLLTCGAGFLASLGSIGSDGFLKVAGSQLASVSVLALGILAVIAASVMFAHSAYPFYSYSTMALGSIVTILGVVLTISAV